MEGILIMKLGRAQKREIRSFVTVITISSVLGALISGLMLLVTGFDSPAPPVNYLLLGFFSGFGISSLFTPLFIFLRRFEPLPLWFVFFVIPLLETLIIGLVYSSFFIALLGYEQFQLNAYFGRTLLISFSATIIFNVYDTLNRLLGSKVLSGLMMGTYRRPVNEDRYVMFLDIAGSTTIAEKLGALEFHAFLNDFFHDISIPIINNHGEIYKYVGDEIIITWKEKNGRRDLRALEVFFEIDETLKLKNSRYTNRYGLAPAFRAGLHFGSIVTGELGYHKQEIAFSGDVMNTASRIQAECRKLGETFLVSEDALANMKLWNDPHSFYTIETMGRTALRGKSSDVSISAVRSRLSTKSPVNT